jgi:hypothetical protein
MNERSSTTLWKADNEKVKSLSLLTLLVMLLRGGRDGTIHLHI